MPPQAGPPGVLSELHTFFVIYRSGLLDSLALPRLVRATLQSGTLRTLLTRIACLNGGLFLGSYLLYYWAIHPLLALLWRDRPWVPAIFDLAFTVRVLLWHYFSFLALIFHPNVQPSCLPACMVCVSC